VIGHTAEYDRQGRTIRTTDANNSDPSNPDPKSSTAAYEPYCVGFATTSARGVRRKANFDSLCRLTQIEVGSPDANPLEVAVASETRVFEYDDLGRVTKSIQSSPPRYGQARFGQDRYGGVSSERSYQYDSLDRVTKVTFEDGKEMSYIYDFEGNVTQVTENASSTTPKVTTFSYYGDNRLHEVTYVRGVGGVDSQTFTYFYDPGGRPLRLEYPADTGIIAYFDDGATPTAGPGWDGNGQLKHLRYVKDGTTTIRRFEFSYDAAGNRITQFDFSPTKATYWAYSYDWLDRLESVKKVETTNTTILAQIQDLPAADALPLMGALQLVSVYSYDAADNRTEFQVPNLSNPALTETFTYSFDDADNITGISKAVGAGSPVSIMAFTSDDDGNLLTKTDLATNVVTEYKWTDHNRLASIETKLAGVSTGDIKQTHTFGVNGFRRKKKDKNDVETTEYAAGLATAVSKAQGGDTVTYLMGHRLMGFERSSDGAMFWFITDSLSTVRDVVRGTDGAVMASYEFAEYGQRISSSESGVNSQKTWVGGLSVQDEVADTGLMMMGHRFYDPGLMGRFLSRDPIGFSGGLNLFEYSRSSPINFTDSTGLQEDSQMQSDYHDNLFKEMLGGTFSWDNAKKWAWSQVEAVATIDIRGQVVDQAWNYISDAVGWNSTATPGPTSIGPASSGEEDTDWSLLLVFAALKSKQALQNLKKKARSAGRCVPESGYFGNSRHGLSWSDNDAFQRAMRTGKPQGRFTKATLMFADEMAQGVPLGQHRTFELPPNMTASVFQADGFTILDADHVFVWHKKSGEWHGYPRVGIE